MIWNGEVVNCSKRRNLMRKKMLKGKEFIHSEGYWNQYINYLETQLEEQQNDFKCERL